MEKFSGPFPQSIQHWLHPKMEAVSDKHPSRLPFTKKQFADLHLWKLDVHITLIKSVALCHLGMCLWTVSSLHLLYCCWWLALLAGIQIIRGIMLQRKVYSVVGIEKNPPVLLWSVMGALLGLSAGLQFPKLSVLRLRHKEKRCCQLLLPKNVVLKIHHSADNHWGPVVILRPVLLKLVWGIRCWSVSERVGWIRGTIWPV